MKTLLATLAIVVVGLIALPNQADAAHSGSGYTYRSGSSSCGCASYTRRVFTGYDCYNRPSYRYYSVPVTHRCRSYYRPSHHRSHSIHRNHYGHKSHYSGHRGHNSHISYRTRHGRVSICR